MQLGNLLTACTLMQTVDILSHRTREASQPFQPRNGAMSVIRGSLVETLPADIRARPVALTRRVACDEIAIIHRLLMFPVTTGITVIGNARGSADACAG